MSAKFYAMIGHTLANAGIVEYATKYTVSLDRDTSPISQPNALTELT